MEVVDALPVLESSLVTAQPDTAVLPASSDSPKQQANNKKRRNRTRRSKSKTAVAQAAAQEAGADVSDVVAVADIASAVANAISASGVTQAFDAVVNNIVARQIKALTPAGQSADPQMRQLFTDLQGKIDTIQAQLEQVSAERDLLKTVLKEELGINDLSKYQEGASKDALGAQYLQLLHVPELAAAYAKEASDLQQEKPDAARAVRLADLIVRAAFQLFPGDGLAEKLARCLLLDAAEAVAETGKDGGWPVLARHDAGQVPLPLPLHCLWQAWALPKSRCSTRAALPWTHAASHTCSAAAPITRPALRPALTRPAPPLAPADGEVMPQLDSPLLLLLPCSPARPAPVPLQMATSCPSWRSPWQRPPPCCWSM